VLPVAPPLLEPPAPDPALPVIPAPEPAPPGVPPAPPPPDFPDEQADVMQTTLSANDQTSPRARASTSVPRMKLVLITAT
jgi:hypothetical protein